MPLSHLCHMCRCRIVVTTADEGAMLLLLAMLLADNVIVASSAPSPGTTCHFVQGQDYAGKDGAVVHGPMTMQECCDACASYTRQLCTAAVWVPAMNQCVVKWGDAKPVRNRPGVIACLFGAAPPAPPPAPPPQQRWPPPPPVPPPAPPPPPRSRDCECVGGSLTAAFGQPAVRL